MEIIRTYVINLQSFINKNQNGKNRNRSNQALQNTY